MEAEVGWDSIPGTPLWDARVPSCSFNPLCHKANPTDLKEINYSQRNPAQSPSVYNRWHRYKSIVLIPTCIFCLL